VSAACRNGVIDSRLGVGLGWDFVLVDFDGDCDPLEADGGGYQASFARAV